MLVLSRKRNESIIINDNITVMVLDIQGDRVRLGIIAPSTIPIHRQEVYDGMLKRQGSVSSLGNGQKLETKEP